MAQSVAYKHYLRALSRFSVDNLRPETRLQDSIQRRIDQSFVTSSAATPSSSDSPTSTVTTPAETLDAIKELQQVNALYSLVENRYQKKYSPSNSLMSPMSNPTYYTDLVKELDMAPTRGIWDRVVNKFRGFLRFS